MGRPPALPAEQKAEIVLAILAGELTVAEAALQAKVSDRSVRYWRRQALASGLGGADAAVSGQSSLEPQIEVNGR